MSLSELLKTGAVEKFESDPEQTKNKVEISKGHLASAKKMLGIEEWEWAYIAAYNSMLLASVALMHAKGYRARGADHHASTIKFVQAVYSKKFSEELLLALDKARKLRNDAVYDTPKVISRSQSETLMKLAETFLAIALQQLETS